MPKPKESAISSIQFFFNPLNRRVFAQYLIDQPVHLVDAAETNVTQRSGSSLRCACSIIIGI